MSALRWFDEALSRRAIRIMLADTERIEAWRRAREQPTANDIRDAFYRAHAGTINGFRFVRLEGRSV